MFARFLPLAGMVALFGIGFVWRAWLQYRRYGQSGIILFRTTVMRERLRDWALISVMALPTAQAIAFAMAPETLKTWTIFAPPAHGLLMMAGAMLLAFGTILMVAAQLRLGKSWRIGIDETAKPGLVTAGLYRVSRNPIFLGMFTILAGLLVLVPTWISMVLFVGFMIGIRMQVLEEEAYLLATYGDAYRQYTRRVGRFVPGLGLSN
jgi:protein-S-isoprenylcysteine O-methyltransferase Ste14